MQQNRSSLDMNHNTTPLTSPKPPTRNEEIVFPLPPIYTTLDIPPTNLCLTNICNDENYRLKTQDALWIRDNAWEISYGKL